MNLRIVLWISFILCFSDVSKGGDNDTPDAWAHILTSHGINHFERWVQVNSDLAVRERKVEMDIPCDFEKAIHFLSDPGNCKQWMKGVAKVTNRDIEGIGPVSQTILNLPWPLKDQELITHYQSQYLDDGSCLIKITSCPNAFAREAKYARIRDYEACWQLQKLDEERVRIVFVAISRDGPRFPRVILDPLMKRVFRDNFNDLKVLLSTL